MSFTKYATQTNAREQNLLKFFPFPSSYFKLFFKYQYTKRNGKQKVPLSFPFSLFIPNTRDNVISPFIFLPTILHFLHDEYVETYLPAELFRHDIFHPTDSDPAPELQDYN